MFRIGEFARIAGVSLRTLRHYDELGLLSPDRLSDNGYRLYAPSDLHRMRQILTLRELGVPLEQIRQVLDGMSETAYLAFLQSHRQVLLHDLNHLQKRITRLDQLLVRSQEASMYSPEIRILSSQTVVSTRCIAQDYQHVTAPMQVLWDRLCQHLEQHPVERTAPDTVIWKGDYGEMDSFELELVFPVAKAVPETQDIHCYTLEGTQVGVVLHRGSYERLGEAYAALTGWLEQQGYERTGHLREVYLHFDPDENSHLTEVHIPVRQRN